MSLLHAFWSRKLVGGGAFAAERVDVHREDNGIPMILGASCLRTSIVFVDLVSVVLTVITLTVSRKASLSFLE